MAKTPPAPEDAPVLDQTVDAEAEGEGAPRKKRFALKLPKLKVKLPKIPLPRIAISKKLLIIIISAVVGVTGAGAAAYAFWPKDPEYPRTPIKRVPKAKKPKKAASAPEAAASAASAPDAAMAAASAPAEAASGPEVPLDRLQRRLGEILGSGASIKPDGPGELRLTARPAASAPVAARERPDVANTARERAHGAGGDKAPRTASAEHLAHDAAARAGKAPAGHASHAHWSYEGPGGPEAWARLKPEFAKCGKGQRQSPIDIRDGIAVNLDPIRFDYQPSAFRVIDNGHTVQVNVAAGNFIEVMGRRYELQQFHFHRPSEERIDGRVFDMDAHLVHKDAEGRLAVVAVLLERGSAQAVVQSVWNNLPLEKGEEQPANVPVDLNQLIPAERGYFTYMGSLTTPPCSEGVLWMVMKTPVQISAEQLAIFSRLYPMNARPVQSAAGRMIKQSN